ncbi:MAG: AIR synthase-related protein [Methanococcaceae archaeon]
MNKTEEKNSGVNTDLGSSCSKTAFNWAKKTFPFRDGKSGKVVPSVDGSYATMIDFDGKKIGISSDGIGTKIEIAERTGIYKTLGFDLMSMTIDDLACSGFIPSSVSNILDVDFLDQQIIDELFKGFYNAAEFSDVSITGGEIAELGSRISGFGNKMHFNWCATAIGSLHPSLDSPFTGRSIEKGDSIITLYNPGFRSNGFSLLRKILTDAFGDEWHKIKRTENENWGDVLLTPSLIYSPIIIEILEQNIKLNGIVHVTGGGVVDNLGRLLKVKKLGARLNDLFHPEDYITDIMKLGNISLEKAYRYWNMNNGLLLILPKENISSLLELVNKDKNYRAKVAGEVTDNYQIEINAAEQNLVYNKIDVK